MNRRPRYHMVTAKCTYVHVIGEGKEEFTLNSSTYHHWENRVDTRLRLKSMDTIHFLLIIECLLVLAVN